VPKFIEAAMKNQPITLYGDGLQTRTFCYIDDNIEATTNALNKDLFINDVVNVGSDIEMTVLDLAKMIIKETGSSSKLIHLPPLEEGDMTRRKPDIIKMKKLLKREMTGIEEGIRKVIYSRKA
jgi:UDP-glucose 4-epimerase